METRDRKNKETHPVEDDLPLEDKSTVSHTRIKPKEFPDEKLLSSRLLFIIIVSVFLAEVVAMIIIFELPGLPYQYMTLLDAVIMTILIFPVLYFLSFRPLVKHIQMRQQAEKAVEAERQRFNDIFETLPGYLVLLTPEYYVSFANRYFRERFGEARGRRCYEYLFERNQPCEVCETYKVLNTMKPGRWEWVGPDGRSYDVYDYPFVDTDGSTAILEMGIDITEQKRAEAQIREMAMFPALNPDGVLQVNGTGLIRMSNPAADRMGFSAGRYLTEIIPEFGELDLAAYIASGVTQHIQKEVHLGERVLIWAIRGAPDLGLAFLYSKDITLHKQAERAVRQLSRIVEQTEDTVLVTNCDGVIEYVNPAFERLTGYPKEEVLGKTPRMLKSEIHDKLFYQNMWSTILAGEVFQGEIANRKKNGELYYEVKTIAPLRDEQGKITHFVATGKDITEHKLDEEKLRRAYDDLELRVQARTEELKIANSELEDEIHVRQQVEVALRRSEQRLSRAQEIAHLGSWELDLINNQLSWSDEVYRIFGLQPQEFAATYEAFLEAVHPDDRAAVDNAYSDSIRNGRNSYEIEHRIVRQSNDEMRIVHEKCEHFRDEAGRIIRSIGMVHDITERKQAQEQMQQLHRTLKALNHSNQAMLRSRSESELLNEVCKVIIDDCGHAMVWIGFKEDDEQKSVRPVASAGFEAGYLDTLKITWADSERGRGPTGTAIRTGQSMRCRNMLTDPQFTPWREEALKRGYASSIVLPLILEDITLGAITIYSRQPDSFAEEEEQLLTELAGDLAYGIMALRLRAAHTQAEEALRLSEEKYRLLADNANDWIYWIKPDRSFQYISPSCERVTGYTSLEFMSNPRLFIDITHPDDQEQILSHLEEAGDEDETHNLEYRIITRKGDIRWVSHSCTPVFTSEGKYMGRNGTNRDITERKHAEEALRRSEALLLQTGETAKVGGWEIDLQTKTPYWSLETYHIHEVDPSVKPNLEEAINYYAPEARPKITEAVRRAMETGQAYDLELPLVTANGRNIWIRTIGKPEFRDGQCVRLFGAFQDITDRKQAEEQLHYQAALLANVNDAIIAADPQFRITAWNAAAESLYGWKAEEIIGQNGVDIIRTEWPETDPADMRRTIAETGRWRGEATQLRKDGTRFPVEVSSIVLRDTNGQTAGYISVNRDITERKQAEEALRKAHDELELRVRERTKELVKEIAERKEIERQLRIRTTAMEAAANGIIITNPQGRIQWTNPALLQITGYTGHELVGENMRIFNSGAHNTDYYQRMWTTILSGQVWRGEVTNRRKDGSLYMEEQTITPVRDESNQIQHFIAIKQDITDRKQAEAELAEWNVRLQALTIAEREQRQLSESLAEAALVLNKSMKLDEVLPLILEQVNAVIPYQLAIVMMFDGESFYDACHKGDARWAQDPTQVKNRFPLEDFPLLAQMRQSHQPVMIADTKQEKNWMIVHGLEWSRSILCVPLLAENQVIGFLNLLAEQPDFFTIEMQDRLVAFASHAAVAIQNAWLFEQVRASSERLQSLSRRLVEIQENERLYIARELHDEAGQMLTALMLDLVTLESQADQPEAVLTKVAEMEQALNAVSENLHSVAMALRPASLDHLGLIPALRQYLESIGERYRLKVSFSSGNFQERLPADMETELYRIVQEALTNVARHARASQADVILTVRDDKLIVIVEDDGKGFNPETVPDTGHLGLFGMRERAEMIGGKLVIESKPGKGTTVMVEVDYDSPIVDRR